MSEDKKKEGGLTDDELALVTGGAIAGRNITLVSRVGGVLTTRELLSTGASAVFTKSEFGKINRTVNEVL
jgi:hypothetical protein